MIEVLNRYQKKEEELLAYTAYLQCLQDNSRFIYRIQRAQAELLIAFQKGKSADLHKIDTILKNGIIILSDDPQENLLVDRIHPAMSESKHVFSGLFIDDVENLTDILTTASLKFHINPVVLNTVLFLLECSDIICKRLGYKHYDNGNPETDKPNLSNLADFNKKKYALQFTPAEIKNLYEQFDITADILQRFTLTAKSGEIRKEVEKQGYSPTIERQPFYKCTNGSYLVLSPSFLLHTAFYEALATMTNLYGESFTKELLHTISQEARAILERAMGVYRESGVIDRKHYLLFQFDTDKIAAVIVAYSTDKNITEIQRQLENKIHNIIPNGKTLHLLIYIPLDELAVCMMPRDHSVCIKIGELRMFSAHPRFTLMNLYYYSQDIQNQVFLHTSSADKETLAYYLQNKCTFYEDEKSNFRWIQGYAQTLKSQYAIKTNVHDIPLPEHMGYIRVAHYDDLPDGTPILAPYLHKGNDFIVGELSQSKIYVLSNIENQFFGIHKELIITLLNWFYAIEKRKQIALFTSDITVYFSISEKGAIKVYAIGFHSYKIHIALEQFTDIKYEDVESTFIKEICRQLVGLDIMNRSVSDGMIDEMFREIGTGRFLQIGYTNDHRMIQDKYSAIYTLSDRWEDKILDEIANHINRKGEESSLDKDESKAVLIEVISFLQEEALKLIKGFDSYELTNQLLQLNHAAIYWSAITNARYEGLAKAYKYIDTKFEDQQKYANDYALLRTISQGIVEYMFMQSVLEKKVNVVSEEKIDRLFALMHHIIDFGCCIDFLSSGLKGAEIVILRNGRVAYPRLAIEISNRYFEKLRTLMMEYPSKIERLRDEIPDYYVDLSSEMFAKAFLEEFGFRYRQWIEVIRKSIEFSYQVGEPVVSVNTKVFRSTVIGEVLNDDEYDAFKKKWMLTSAQKHDALRHRDFFLQRFNRNTQFSTRPWILMNGKVLYSTKIIYESIKILQDRISYGIFRGESRVMRKYISGIIEGKGKHFNRCLHDYYEKLGIENLRLYSEVKIKPGAKLTGPKDIGDIDLLLIKEDTKQIVCIEAKNYYEARDVYSLLDQNSKTEKDILKAERRDQWCKENILQFKKICPDVSEEYSVSTIFLTYNEPAYRYFEHASKTSLPVLCAIEILDKPEIVFAVPLKS